jgi:hypothetical protein
MMLVAEVGVLVVVGLVVMAPLGREYLDLRRSWGFGRLAALGTTLLVLPAMGVGFALSLPLASEPALQWATTVVAALLAYSLFAAVVRSSAEPAQARSRR